MTHLRTIWDRSTGGPDKLIYRGYYLQDYMMKGLKKILLGIRSNTRDGYINTIEEFDITSLPGECRRFWNPDEMTTSAVAMLNLIAQQFNESSPNVEKVVGLKFFLENERGDKEFAIYDLTGKVKVFPDWFLQ